MGVKCNNMLDKIMVILRGFGLIMLYMFLAPILMILFKSLPFSDTFIGKNITYILAELVTMLILIAIFHQRFFKDWKDFKVNYKKYLKQVIFYWIIGFVLMFLSNILINTIISDGIAVNESANRNTLATLPIYSVLAMCIMAPICEELLFRASFKEAFKHAITFSLFTGILFAGMHVATGIESWSISYLAKNWHELLYFIPYGSIGVAFGYAFYKTNNIFSSISLHMLHNTISVAFILLATLLGGA